MTRDEERRACEDNQRELARKDSMMEQEEADWRSGFVESSLGLGRVKGYETTVNGFDLSIEPDRYRTARKTLKTEYRWRARLLSGAFKPWSEMLPTLGLAMSEAEKWARQQKAV